ncbi:MAG: DUF86 domain-containing protein [Thermodesulfovibrionales bacterium]|nr:DUF86 domain-containing protein [Thermodesulfovibrionales bacterium]
MVISSLRTDKIEKNLHLIQEFILGMKELSRLSLEEFLSDKRNPAAAESYLRRALETIFDTCRHILAKSYGFKELEYKEIAKKFGEKIISDKDYSRILIKMAGYRNRMVHMYHEVSAEELYEIIKNNLSDIERFITEVTRFLEHYKKGKG